MKGQRDPESGDVGASSGAPQDIEKVNVGRASAARTRTRTSCISIEQVVDANSFEALARSARGLKEEEAEEEKEEEEGEEEEEKGEGGGAGMIHNARES